MAPTDTELKLLHEALRSLETHIADRFRSLDTRLDKQDSVIDKTNTSISQLREDMVSAKTGLAIGQWFVGLLGLGGVISLWRWVSSGHG